MWLVALSLAIALGSAVGDRYEERAAEKGGELSRQVAALVAAARAEAGDAGDELGARKSSRANLEKAVSLMRGNEELTRMEAYTSALVDLATLILTEEAPAKDDLEQATGLLEEAWQLASRKVGGEEGVFASAAPMRARIARDRGLAELLAGRLDEARRWYEVARGLGAGESGIDERLELIGNLERWGG